MAISANLRIEGADALLRKLQGIPRKVERQIVRDGLRAGARVIQAAAKREAPRDSGDLAESIVVRAARRLRRGQIGIDVRTDQGFFKGEQFYAGFIEFGWDKQETYRAADGTFRSLPRGEGVTTHVPPNPFMRRAADAAGDAAGRVAAELIRRGIEQAARS